MLSSCRQNLVKDRPISAVWNWKVGHMIRCNQGLCRISLLDHKGGKWEIGDLEIISICGQGKLPSFFVNLHHGKWKENHCWRYNSLNSSSLIFIFFFCFKLNVYEMKFNAKAADTWNLIMSGNVSGPVRISKFPPAKLWYYYTGIANKLQMIVRPTFVSTYILAGWYNSSNVF